MRGLRALLCLMALALPVQGQEVVADLSQNRVAITANFDGSEILIFGAIRDDTGPVADDLEVVITVSGPAKPVTVRRKDRRLGIWVNTDAVEVDAAPTFYAVNTTKPLDQVLSDTDDLRNKITVDRAIRSVGAPDTIQDSLVFSEALIRIRQRDDLYQTNEGAVTLKGGTLFRTTVDLPANLVEGLYETRIFLTQDREVISSFTTTLNVEKTGLERILYNLAHNNPLIYGLLSLAIAIAAGWGASAVFRLMRLS